MGWKSKLLFMLIVYFAGFATAIYYLAPGGIQSRDSNGAVGSADQSDSAGRFNGLCDKACAKASASFSGVDFKEFKEKFNLRMQKLMEMSRNSKAVASQNTNFGSEDK